MTAVLPSLALPATVHEQVEHEIDVAYADGYRQALVDVCARIVEVEHLNRGLWDAARAAAKHAVITRRAAMEEAAQSMYERQDRVEYRGGAVQWDAGQSAPVPQEGQAK